MMKGTRMGRRAIAAAAAMLWLPLTLGAQQTADFWRIREGASVVLVVGTGGECKGKVARRQEGELAIKLSETTDACGARESLVTVREANTRAVERAARSGGKRAAAAAAVVGAAAGTGLLVTAVPPRAALGVLAGGFLGSHLLSRELTHEGPGKGYVIYVSRLG
jgi:hypothetical protein